MFQNRIAFGLKLPDLLGAYLIDRLAHMAHDMEAIQDVDGLLGLLGDDAQGGLPRHPGEARSGVEGRVPLLDHCVAELGWRLPLEWNLRGSTGKWLLRRLLHRLRPRVDRPKMGFGVPIDVWLRGPLRGLAEALLDEHRLRREGLLEPGPIREVWSEHVAGRGYRQHDLWNVLMLQAWIEEQRAPSPVAAGSAVST